VWILAAAWAGPGVAGPGILHTAVTAPEPGPGAGAVSPDTLPAPRPTVAPGDSTAARDAGGTSPDTTGTGPVGTRGSGAPAIAPSGVPAAPESLEMEPLRPRRTLPRRSRLDQPRWVMLRSLLVPGWGQAHNHAWIKAAIAFAGDGALRVRFLRDERRLGDLNAEADGRLRDLQAAEGQVTLAEAELEAAQASGDSVRIAAAEAALVTANLARAGASEQYNTAVIAYNALLDTSVRRRWILGGVILLAMIDAYVDAHFKNFDIDMRLDPALPGGAGSPGARLGLRWRF